MLIVLELLFKFLVGHALADMAWQPDAMAKGKNRNRKTDYIPEGQKYVPCWPYWLSAHALVHGGAVYVISGNLFIGLFETVAHWLIDFAKCENKTNPHIDQLLHFICKLIYIYILI